LKANGKEDCAGDRDCTLAKENGRFVYEKFADFWRDSLVHYAQLGIVPDWVSIENEPSFIPLSWEGCKFGVTSEGGSGNYVVFRNVTGTSFTLTATPGTTTGNEHRAPVNGIQIVYPSGS
jgi:hypothetical protein